MKMKWDRFEKGQFDLKKAEAIFSDLLSGTEVFPDNSRKSKGRRFL